MVGCDWGGVRMWFLVFICIMVSMISVIFLGINLNGGKICGWRYKRERGRLCFKFI